jgi:cytoskeletal protein RodZ
MEGSTFTYSVDGGAFVSWESAVALLTAGTHTLVAQASHSNYEDVTSQEFVIAVAAAPAAEGSDAASTAVAAGTAAGSAGSGSGSAGTGASTGGAGSVTPTTSGTAGSEAGQNAANAVAGEAAGAAGALTSNNASSEASGAPTQEVLTQGRMAWLTLVILSGLVLTAAYGVLTIKRRIDELTQLKTRLSHLDV